MIRKSVEEHVQAIKQEQELRAAQELSENQRLEQEKALRVTEALEAVRDTSQYKEIVEELNGEYLTQVLRSLYGSKERTRTITVKKRKAIIFTSETQEQIVQSFKVDVEGPKSFEPYDKKYGPIAALITMEVPRISIALYWNGDPESAVKYGLADRTSSSGYVGSSEDPYSEWVGFYPVGSLEQVVEYIASSIARGGYIGQRRGYSDELHETDVRGRLFSTPYIGI